MDYFNKTTTKIEEIYKIMSSLNTNQPCWLNRILTKILHLVQDQIYNHLATIYNLFFSTGMLPTILKTTQVITSLLN